MSSGLEFRIDQLVVDLDLKTSAARGYEFPRGNLGLKFLNQVRRDTHGSGGIVSSSAVFDRDLGHVLGSLL